MHVPVPVEHGRMHSEEFEREPGDAGGVLRFPESQLFLVHDRLFRDGAASGDEPDGLGHGGRRAVGDGGGVAVAADVAGSGDEPCDGDGDGGGWDAEVVHGDGDAAGDAGLHLAEHRHSHLRTWGDVPAGFVFDEPEHGSAFRMSKYEITRAQWMAVTGWAVPSQTSSFPAV